MKRTNRILLFIFCITLLLITGAVSAEKTCVCLNEEGVKYGSSASGSSLCYTCNDGICTPNGKTLSQCNVEKKSESTETESKPEKSVQQEPTAAPVKIEQPAPVQQEPTAAPVKVEQPAPVQQEPVAAPVQIEQPAPVQQEPVAAPIKVEQPAPVHQEPVTAPVQIEQPAPVHQEPTAAPVIIEQAAPTITIINEEPEAAPVNNPTEVISQAGPVVTIAETETASQAAPVLLTTEDTEPAETAEAIAADNTNAIVPLLISTEETAETEDKTEDETEAEQTAPVTVSQPIPVLIPTEEEDDESESNAEETVNTSVPVLISPEETNEPESVKTDDKDEDNEITLIILPTEEIESTPEAEPTSEETLVTPETEATEETLEGDPEETPEADATEEGTEGEEITETPEATVEAETEEEVSSLLSVSIEGKLSKIGLTSPDGETYTDPAVTFTWVYFVSDTSAEVDVDFTLSLTINDNETGQTTSSQTVVSSATCAGFICQYTAGAELSGYTDADVTWTVSGSFDDAGSIVTINAENPSSKSFSLKVSDPTPTPDPSPTPTPKPKAPVQECPVGRYLVRSLGFYWAPSANAESYTVNWWDNNGHKGSINLSNSDSTCQKGRCIAHATMPGTGKYTWTVTAKNSAGSAKSKEMKFEIDTNISTPNIYRPNGTIINRNYPSFEWEDVRDGAIEYRIQVVGKYDNRIRMDRWFKVSDIYVGNGICFVQTDLFLPAGTYCWRVQARNADFSSGWSNWLDFYVECDYCTYNTNYYNTYTNTVLSTSYPTGTITTTQPEFQWRTLTGASWYQVKLYDHFGKTLLDRQVSSSSCTAEICTWDPGYKMPGNGNYSWSVSGYGSNNALWGTASGAFTVSAVIAMNPMSYVSPEQNGYLGQKSPLIIWTDPGETTASFNVQIFNKDSQLLFSADLNREQAWCDGMTCSIEFQSIPDAENYRIAITQFSELNTQGETIQLVFSKGSQLLRLSSPKEGSRVQARPLFRWSLDAGETAQYELILTDAQNNVTMFTPLVCDAEGVTCDNGEAFFSPANPLASGSYTAKLGLRTGNAVSEELHFTVN